MKRKFRNLAGALVITTMLFTGCSATQSTQSTSTTTTQETTTDSTASTTATAATDSNDTTTTQTSSTDSTEATTTQLISATVLDTSTIAVNTEFTESDLSGEYDSASAIAVQLNGSSAETTSSAVTVDGSTITITDEGTYVFSGTLDDGQIVVDAEDTDKVQIVFNGVTINCSDSAPVYIKNADKVFLTLEAGTDNTLTDGTEYVQTDENTVDGVIFSKTDLTLNGEGSLTIEGNYQNGIVVKDEFCITGGTYSITAVKDGINSNDGVKINGGTITISAETGSGIQSKNSEDSTKGYIYICGGEVNVTNSVEGIEGTAVIIEGGTINITSSDDGFNATNGMAATTTTSGMGKETSENDSNAYLSISGGTIKVNASGDGLDSNGSMFISGGTIYVSGPDSSGNGALDYNGTADITGGTIIAVGSSGMAQGFSDTSTQYSILNNFSSTSAAGTEITITDADGNVLASFTPDKQYQSVVVSSPDLENGGTYTLTSGSQTADITISSIVTSNGETTGMGGHGGRIN